MVNVNNNAFPNYGNSKGLAPTKKINLYKEDINIYGLIVFILQLIFLK